MQSSFKVKIMAYIEITRPWWILVLLPVLLGPAFIGSNGHIPIMQLLTAVLSFTLIKCSSTVFNDYFDRNIDRIIHANRPLPSGRLTEKEVFIFATLLMISGFIVAYFVNVTFLILGAFSSLFYLLHIWKIKKNVSIPGIATIGTNFSISLIVLGGWAIDSPLNFLSLYIALLVFLWDMSHDTASAIRDYKGDRSEGLQSFAVSFGKKTASKIATVLFIIVIFMSLYLSVIIKLYYLMIIIFVFSLFLVRPFLRLLQDPNHENAANAHKTLSFYLIALFVYIIIAIILKR